MKSMNVTTFGEALFRFSSPKGERLATTQTLDFRVGGTELNVAANLHSLGYESSWVSSLPDGLVGELLRDRISALGVSLKHVETIPQGKPGWYLVEPGSAPRADVALGRWASSLAEAKDFSFDWKKILQGQSLFHTSGVMSGLSSRTGQEVLKAMQAAKAAGIPVSYDFNYRKNLWTTEEAKKRQQPLLSSVDFLFCGSRDLELFFGSADPMKAFNATSAHTLIMGWRSSDETEYGVDVVTHENHYSSRRHRVENIDRIGVGDSMTAGFLAAFLEHGEHARAAEFAAAAGALKYSIKGDMALLKKHEVAALATDGYQGVKR